ncbi:hypothetical protein [Jeotgalibacillus terrae]|uniref:D-alanyl-lipoteichoic acid biosynthesis protein DltD n=1 Tax=Jeotgalibacillus terrae TaxID=587735 RepID=A0ABW5ZBW0_9BACL|nr:hypothetical protein [Jeotgalibacillus terrae]MBM7577814.1 hypothetical protein [Jeotgalibacillus terrae]
MSGKKFIMLFFSSVIGLVGTIALAFYILDPLFYYRDEGLIEPQYNADARYQMPGLLRNKEYETLITATSMGRNFREDYVDDTLNTESLNGSLASSYAKEQSMVAQFALQENEQLNHVIWELNFYSFAEDPEKVLDSATPFPTYMYDDSKLNDIKYLFHSYNVRLAANNVLANVSNDELRRNPEELYKFGQVAPEESIERIDGWLQRAPELQEYPENETKEVMIASFKENVIQVIEDNPDTTFTFFYAPYPVYNQHRYYLQHNRYLEERLAFKEEVFELLSQYDNAELYDFQDQKEITFDAGNYMADAVHYYEYINEYIINTIASEDPVTSKTAYDQQLENLKNQVINFNVDQLRNVGYVNRDETEEDVVSMNQ